MVDQNTPEKADIEDEMIGSPEDIKQNKSKQKRNMLLLLLFCALVGGGGFIYISEPTPQTDKQTQTDLDRRLALATGTQKHPSLAGRRDYGKDFADKVEGEVSGVKGSVESVEGEVSTNRQQLNKLSADLGKFLQMYEQDKLDRQTLDENLAITLATNAQEIQRLSNSNRNNGFPPDVSDTSDKGEPSREDDAQHSRKNREQQRSEPKLRKIERSVFKLDATSTQVKKIKSMFTDEYLPAGSYAQGRIIMGAKTSAAVDAQSDPRPILIRLNSVARGPVGEDGRHAETDVNGCTVTASAYGDISSEQGHAKLQEMTCTVGEGEVKTTRVYGYIGHKGMYGVHSKVVMREGDLAERAFWAGMLANGGQAANMLIGETSQSALGNVKTVGGPSDAALSLLTGGVEKTSQELGRYYMKRLEQIQPVLPLKAGTDVVVVFMKGTNLDGSEPINIANNEKKRIPLDAPGSDIAPDNINQQLIQLLKQQQPQDATKTNWNNELY
ncbi:TraB/VirB10 family protein [Vibrio mediterranei]|uniref:Conjugal transfer protein TraB n=1 Tax=Vibrio mediterranei TaxID=689 RepID=A0ABX5D661_9VIBR|nr:TraB/VirB10 family protein [Vibrio mediterranei]PRQ65173.1 hypothetical protein COR51_23925 [Vibrio mediterranei]